MGRRRGGTVGVPGLSEQAKGLVEKFNKGKTEETVKRFSEGVQAVEGKLAGIIEKGEKTATGAMTAVQPIVDGWKNNKTFATAIRKPGDKIGLLGARRKTLRTKFDHCVKAVRKTVKARKGSNKEAAAIAICTTTLLHPRGRTMKRYRKGRLLTQKRR